MTESGVGASGLGLGALGLLGVLWNTQLRHPQHVSQLVCWVTVGTGAAVCLYALLHKPYTKMEELFINCSLFIRGIDDKIIVPKKRKTIRSDNSKDYVLSMPKGLCLEQFKQKEQNISQAMNASVKFDYNNGVLIMSTKEGKIHKTYPFTQIHTENPLEIILGYSLDGIVTLDLASAPSPHLLVAGETNSGKSVLLRGIITQLILDKTDIELYLIDPKRVEFSIFRRCKLVRGFAREDDEIRAMLSEITFETDNRYRKLERAGCTNIKSYNRKVKDKLKYMLIVVDEFADLADNDDIIDSVHYIARKARAVGIHLILATQRPDKDILNGKIKANIGNVLGLKTSTNVNSEIIIGKYGLEKLRGFGHGLLKNGSDFTELQSMMIEEDEAKKLIKHTFTKDEVKIMPVERVRGYI